MNFFLGFLVFFYLIFSISANEDSERWEKLLKLVDSIDKNIKNQLEITKKFSLKENKFNSSNENNFKEKIFLKIPNFQVFYNTSQEQIFSSFYNETIKDSSIDGIFLVLDKQKCLDKDCVKKVDSLIENINKKTNVTKKNEIPNDEEDKIEDEKNKEKLLLREKIFLSFPKIAINLIEDQEISCIFCNHNFSRINEIMQDPLAEEFLIAYAKKTCSYENCSQNIEKLLFSENQVTNSTKRCEVLCQKNFKENENLNKMIKNKNLIKERIFSRFPNVATSLIENCHINNSEIQDTIKNPLAKEFFLEFIKQDCPDEDCFKKMKALVKSIIKKTDVNKQCKSLCDTEKLEKIEVNESIKKLGYENKLLKERFHSNCQKNSRSSSIFWNKIACTYCKKYHYFLHQSFEKISLGRFYLNAVRKFCEDDQCYNNVGRLFTSIISNTDTNKACEPICGSKFY